MLRLLSEELRVGIGENEDAVIAIDGAEPASHVARQARVPGGMEVAGAHALAGVEERRRRGGAAVGTTLSKSLGDFGGGEGRSHLRPIRAAALKFRLRD